MLLMVLNVLFVRQVGLSPARVDRAAAWSSPAFWDSSTCSVLNAGVAYRGACQRDTHFAPGAGKYSECPGYTKCADEGGDCECVGTVVLAAGKYGFLDIPDFVRPSAELTGQAGLTKCDVKSFSHDPLPGTAKACFCLPAAVADIVKEKGPLDAERCRDEGDRAYWEASSPALLAEKMADEDEDELVETPMEEVNNSLLSKSCLLELPDGFDNRRRGGCRTVYLPWALVEVTATDAFGAPKGTGKLRCAYEYGADVVSREQEVDPTEKAYVELSGFVGNSRSCDVRGSCAVALNPVRKLAKDQESSSAMTISSIGVFLATIIAWESFNGFVGAAFNFPGGPDDFMVFAGGNGLLALISLVFETNDGAPNQASADVEALVFGVIGFSLLGYGLPTLVYETVSKRLGGTTQGEGPRRVALRRQNSAITRAVLRQTNSTRTLMFGPTRPASGSRVRLIKAEGDFPVGSEGYVAGIDGEIAVFQSLDGDMVRISVASLEVIS